MTKSKLLPLVHKILSRIICTRTVPSITAPFRCEASGNGGFCIIFWLSRHIKTRLDEKPAHIKHFVIFFTCAVYVQSALCSRHSYIEHSALFLNILIKYSFLVRTHAFIGIYYKYNIKFKSLWAMHSSQYHSRYALIWNFMHSLPVFTDRGIHSANVLYSLALSCMSLSTSNSSSAWIWWFMAYSEIYSSYPIPRLM